MSNARSDIMTVQDLAEYLRLSEMTVYRLAQDGKIPALKIGRSWRFKRELIDEWFRQESTSVMAGGFPPN